MTVFSPASYTIVPRDTYLGNNTAKKHKEVITIKVSTMVIIGVEIRMGTHGKGSGKVVKF